MATKFLFIHSNNEPQEVKTLDALGSVLFFRESFLNQSYSDIFSKYDVIVLDVSDVKYRQWFSSYKTAITTSANIRCVFLHPSHCHIDEKLMKILKDDWKIGSVIKELPKMWASREDLVTKLISNIHLASLELPNVESCFKSFLQAAAAKLGCGTD